jgi:hypothetical protein
MIKLIHFTEIKAPPKKIFDFFMNYKDNFAAWHPDHFACRYLTEGPLREGSVIYEEEKLHGKLHKLQIQITKIEQKRSLRIDYKTNIGTMGFLRIEPYGVDSSLFTAEIHIGFNIPIIGEILNHFLWLFLSRRIKGIDQHMIEEGNNLKALIEKGTL